MNEVRSSAVATDPERDSVLLALADPAYFHITMAITAQLWHTRVPQVDLYKYWYHRGKAIETLNRSFSLSTNCVTDAMICTVAMLAYIDVSCNLGLSPVVVAK